MNCKEAAMALADKVKEPRQKLGWNQTTLAQKSGITQATISRIESGKVTQPRMGQLRKLADALGTTIDYLARDSTQMFYCKECGKTLGEKYWGISYGLTPRDTLQLFCAEECAFNYGHRLDRNWVCYPPTYAVRLNETGVC